MPLRPGPLKGEVQRVHDRTRAQNRGREKDKPELPLLVTVKLVENTLTHPQQRLF